MLTLFFKKRFIYLTLGVLFLIVHVVLFPIYIMLQADTLLWLITVAALWGFTTPLLRRASKGIERIKYKGFLKQWAGELWFLATNWEYAVPFLINQSGSVVYAVALGTADLSLAVPLTNALNFVFVSLAGRLLGEQKGNALSYLGMALVFSGVTLCVLDRIAGNVLKGMEGPTVLQKQDG